METYDYIIIGAGSAGCVLANRLSADPAHSVLLLEAGDPDKFAKIHIPGAYTELFNTKYDWAFYSEPQKNINNRRLFLPRGKTLGGCSSTNAMAYVRGNANDYDQWSALGNRGWSYQEVLPYFKKSEHNEQIKNEFHQQGGELHVSFLNTYSTPYSSAFVDAARNVGIPTNNDYNGAKQNGAGHFQFNIKKGKRWSAATAFLKPALKRKNLKVLTKAQVQKILIEKDRVIGVQFKREGNTQELKASREVILSAGAFNSPQLLMLSGIGPKEELAKHGIECIKELPGVGQNLQDHLFFPVMAVAKQNQGSNHYLKPINKMMGLAQYLLSKKGPFTAGPLAAVAFLNQDKPEDQVDLQLHFAPIHIGENYGYDMYDLKNYPRYDGFTILPSLLQPKSRGSLKLASADPEAAPIIDPNFLSEDADLQALVKGAKWALKIFQQDAFLPYLKEFELLQADADEERIIDHIKKTVETIYHPVGTCKMGNDPMAVVDSHLSVHGIGGLRVIDASIMPTIISGNTNAPVYMIAEKGADLILNS